MEERFDVDTLWVDSALTRPVEIDWAERWDDGEGWESFEAPECGECGSYADWDDEEREWVCGNEECGNHGREIEIEDGGPMMSYFYPLSDLRRVGDDVYEAAARIRDLPLCVVEFGDGTHALALTGGGMDLSWEICDAFTRLGYLPPLHFCDLPRLAGKQMDEGARYVVAACTRTAKVVAGWAEDYARRLSEFGEA